MIVALLFYNDEDAFAGLTQQERNALVERHVAFNQDVLQRRALMMVNRALQPSSTGRMILSEGGDLPKRMAEWPLSGFYLIDCTDLDEAEELAGQYPMPPGLGYLEVRPALAEWDYAPSVDLDATTPEDVWERHTDLAGWPGWMTWVTACELHGELRVGATAEVDVAGVGRIGLVVERLEPPTVASFSLRFPGAEEVLSLELSSLAQPRQTTRVMHRAEVPRGLLDTVGTPFSAHLNQGLRDSLRQLAAELRGLTQDDSRGEST